MITNWEQLGEVLSEFENRLSYLEMSQPVRELEERELPQVQPTPKELRESQHRTQVLVSDLMNRVNGHIKDAKIGTDLPI